MIRTFLLILTLFGLISGQALAAMTPATDGLFSTESGGSPPAINGGYPVNAVKTSLEGARQWFLSATLPSGLFVYLYNPSTGKTSINEDVLRQLMSTRLLGELATEDIRLAGKHKKNLETALSRWYREDMDGNGFVVLRGESELGSNAMALMAITASPFFEAHANKALNLAKGIVSLQNQDGSFDPYFVKPIHLGDREYSMAFYSGEATLALLRYYKKTRKEAFLQAAIKAQDHYLDKYVTHLEDNYYPAYVPWQTFCLVELYKLTQNQKYADAVFTLNDKLLEIQETRQHPGRFFDRDFSRYGGTHSSSDGIFTESLAYALEMAKLQKDKDREKVYREAIGLAVHNLLSLQYARETSRAKKGRPPVNGAFKVRSNDGRIRIDSTQHIMDAYRKILEVW